MLNPDSLQCTNALHKVVFDSNLTMAQRRWVCLSLLSDFSQMMLERYGRHYGNGMLKIEPSTLKGVPVFLGSNKSCPIGLYNEVLDLVDSGDKRAASRVATKLVQNEAGISQYFANQVKGALKAMRSRRS